MASALMSISLTDDSLRVIERSAEAPERVASAITDGLRRGLVMLENYIKTEQFTGGEGAGGGELPLGTRTGGLRQGVKHELDSASSGYYGVGSPAQAYARVQMGPDDTVMKPKNANHLWVPVADNKGPSGQMRMSPREAMEQMTEGGKRRLRIFKSKAGNLVAFLPDAGSASGGGGRYARGQKKGMQRGRLLFVLKDEVTIRGTDALFKAWEARGDVFEQTMNQVIQEAL